MPLLAGSMAALLMTLGLSLVAPSLAQASTVSDIAPSADSTGPIVVDSAGNGYVAWHNTVKGDDDSVDFCKIPVGGTCTSPRVLPIPTGANWGDYQLLQPFPVLGTPTGSRVDVVAPSYDQSTVAVWTSTNGGASFGSGPTVIPSPAYAGNTSDDDILRSPDTDLPNGPDSFSIASHNPGLGYTFTSTGTIGAMDPPYGFQYGLDGVPGGVTSSTEGYGKTVNPGPSQFTQTIQAFATNSDPNYLGFYWAPTPGTSGSPSDESGPFKVANGSNPRLSGGPGGLFLLSEDDGAPGSNTFKIDVRKWNPTSHIFGAPTLVATIPTGIYTENAGGLAEDASTGALTVAWPTFDSGGAQVLQTWTSTNGGATFSAPTTVTATDGYSGPARLATVGGHGFITWQDDRGLQLAALPSTQTGPYSPLAPTRICDTRPGNPSSLSGAAAQCNGPGGVGTSGTTIPTGGSINVNVANGASTSAATFSVPSDATAVVLNVTAVAPSTSGYLTVYPAGSSRPLTSNLNYAAGEVVPNLVEVGTGSGGDISIYSQAKTDVVVDLEGYVAPAANGGVGAGLYNPLSSPARLCDTRAGNPSGLSGGDAQCNGVANAGERLGANGTIPVKVATLNGIPTGATAAVLNVTVVNPTAGGYLTVYPQGAAQPNTANVNYTAGQTTGNRVIVPLSTSGATPGDISVYSSSAADVVVDVSGYYSAPAATGVPVGPGAQFSAETAPVRICDTRAGNPSGLTGLANQCNGKTLGSTGTDTLQVSGLAGVPSGAKAVVVNLTAIAPTQGTFLTVFPGPSRPLPLTSTSRPAT